MIDFSDDVYLIANKNENERKPSTTRYLTIFDLLIAALIGCLSIAIGFHATILKYHYSPIENDMMNIPVHYLRPIVDNDFQEDIKICIMLAETLLITYDSSNVSVRFKYFDSTLSPSDTKMLPEWMYRGITVGITSENSHNLEYTALQKYTSNDLENELLNLKPSKFFRRFSTNKNLNWKESGYALYFAFDSLEKAENSSIALSASEAYQHFIKLLLPIARKFHQVYILLWYPHEFGNVRHLGSQVIIEEIVPTRTGLNNLKSSFVIWKLDN